jgi:putative ABC transport system substrate-binding protein
LRSAQFLRSAAVKRSRKGFALIIFSRLVGPVASAVAMTRAASAFSIADRIATAHFFTTEVNAKRLGLLRELVPTAARVALLMNPMNALNTSATLKEVEPAARALGLQIQVFNTSTSLEIDAAFAALVAWRPDAQFVAPDGFFTSRRVQLAALAARHALPATFPVREFPAAGGLMSYGTSITDAYRQAGIYAARILNGAKPADLPVTQSTRFELVINLKTAKALGLDVPLHLQQLADEVIE